jgi:hypothetical protein
MIKFFDEKILVFILRLFKSTKIENTVFSLLFRSFAVDTIRKCNRLSLTDFFFPLILSLKLFDFYVPFKLKHFYLYLIVTFLY